MRFVVTCEHGGNVIPKRYGELFAPHRALLDSHRGWDPGALDVARALAAAFAAPCVFTTTSRLLIDVNRSDPHPKLFSQISRTLARAERDRIVARYYRPYRERAQDEVRKAISSGARVVHVSSHSFTPVLDGRVRRADVALLYDPQRRSEAALCDAWSRALAQALPDLRVRRNYPYRGTSDGLTTSLRRAFPADRYVGIEIEINHRLLAEDGALARVRKALIETLRGAAVEDRQTRSTSSRAPAR